MKLLILLVFSSLTWAMTNQYLTMDEPEGWKCDKSQRIWICQSKTEPDRRESLVMTIGMVATDWDNLQNYENYLKAPKKIKDEKGVETESKVTYVRRRNINGYVWIDSLHQNSELPGFYTRYLATVHNQLAILVTYIVSEERYQILAPVFERMVSSLKPNKEFNFNVSASHGEPIPKGAEIIGSQKDIIAKNLRQPGEKPGSTGEGEAKPAEPANELPIMQIALVLIAFAVAYVLIKKSGKKGP